MRRIRTRKYFKVIAQTPNALKRKGCILFIEPSNVTLQGPIADTRLKCKSFSTLHSSKGQLFRSAQSKHLQSALDTS